MVISIELEEKAGRETLSAVSWEPKIRNTNIHIRRSVIPSWFSNVAAVIKIVF